MDTRNVMHKFQYLFSKKAQNKLICYKRLTSFVENKVTEVGNFKSSSKLKSMGGIVFNIDKRTGQQVGFDQPLCHGLETDPSIAFPTMTFNCDNTHVSTWTQQTPTNNFSITVHSERWKTFYVLNSESSRILIDFGDVRIKIFNARL